MAVSSPSSFCQISSASLNAVLDPLPHGLQDQLPHCLLRSHDNESRPRCKYGRRQARKLHIFSFSAGFIYHHHQRNPRSSDELVQSLRASQDSGATPSFDESYPANGFDVVGESSYTRSAMENGRRMSGESFKRQPVMAGATASDASGGGTIFYGDAMERNWDLDGDDLLVTPNVFSGLDPEQHSGAAIWQPEELKRAGIGLEADLRFMFLEQLMGRARQADVAGAEETISDMAAVGLKPGPRSYHGLVVSYSRSGDVEGALHALRREVNCGYVPLPETFTAVVRSFACVGKHQRGEQLLGAMEHYKLDGRITWLTLVEELLRNGYLSEATAVFLKGSQGGYRATDKLFDALVKENALIGSHANCIHILRQMEYFGRDCETFHYNCLLMVEANLGEADIALERFESMRYGDDNKKPDTESYNWLLLAQVRSTVGGDRIPQILEVLGLMVEDHKKVQPNARTYMILVEGFTKYNIPDEATRHFRALSRFPFGMQLLHDEGKHGDPLSLYLRLLCLHGRIDDMFEALETMKKENQMLSKRAMIVNRKGRTMVSSWLEPLQQEADLGYEIDYIARYIAEGGLTGTRQRWSPSFDGKSSPVNPDNEGFRFAAPMEASFKKHCAELRATYTMNLIKKLKRDGVGALGRGATEEDISMILEKLRKDMLAESVQPVRKPKAASKMLVSELKEELEAQGLPSDGTRPILYQRVQKSRRINRARGRPLWLPPEVEQAEEVDSRLDRLMSRLNLKNENNTEYWKKRFLGQSTEDGHAVGEGNEDDHTGLDGSGGEHSEGKRDDTDGEEDGEEEVDDAEDAGEEEEEVEPQVLLATQLMDNEEALEMQRRDEYYFEFNLEEQLADLKRYRIFGVEDMYTIADVWGWTWDKDIDAYQPEKWSKEREVKLGLKLLRKVVDLGGIPTIGDCAMLLRAAIRTPWPEAMVNVLQQTHKLGYVFGSPIYNEVVTSCMNLDEREAAIAIVTDMEDTGIIVPDEILDKIIPEESPLDK